MKKARIRILKHKTKKIFKLTFEIITGYESLNHEKIREKNIKFLFTHTIYWMDDIAKEYDSCYNIVKDYEQAKQIAYQKLSV